MISQFVANDPINTQMLIENALQELVIVWINLTTKSTKIGIQRILAKPQ